MLFGTKQKGYENFVILVKSFFNMKHTIFCHGEDERIGGNIYLFSSTRQILVYNNVECFLCCLNYQGDSLADQVSEGYNFLDRFKIISYDK